MVLNQLILSFQNSCPFDPRGYISRQNIENQSYTLTSKDITSVLSEVKLI